MLSKSPVHHFNGNNVRPPIPHCVPEKDFPQSLEEY
jgi:hypothetical protein